MKTVTDLRIEDDQVTVFLDGEKFGNVPIRFIENFGLRFGMKLTEIVIERLLKADQIMQAKQRAIASFETNPKQTKSEIVEFLRDQKFSSESIAESVRELEMIGYIKDEDFARKWIKRRSKMRGRKMLRLELIEKGVDLKTIDRTLAEIDSQQENSQVLELAHKQIRRYRSVDDQTAKRRLIGFLLRRGFGYDVVSSVADRVLLDRERI